MARSVAGRSEDRTSDDDESKKVGKVGEPLSATPQSLSSPKDSIHSSSSPTPDPNRQNGSKKLPTCPMTPSDNMSVHADDDVTVEEASQQKKAVSSQNKNEPKLIVPEGEDNTEIFKEEFSEKEGDEKSDDGMKRDDEPFHESSKEEESHIEEEQEVDYEEDESQHEDVQPKKVKKGRNISKGRVSAQLNGEIIDEKAQKTPSKNGPTKKRSREDQQGDLMETEISPEVWVEIESPNKQSTSDTNEEGGENEEEKKPAKKARRTHLAEKSTNVKREAIRGKAEQKEQVKATRAKSNGVIPRRSEEKEPKRRLTPRQKDLHETSKTKTVSPLMLNLPSGFEKAAKKALQACFNDKMKAVEGDSILILLDLFQHFNDPDLTDEPKKKRLTRLSRILEFQTDKSDSIRIPLTLLQQRILLWIAEEEMVGKVSGLKPAQAIKALEFMVEEVEDHGPTDRWHELWTERDFKVKTLGQLRVRSKELVKSVTSALKKGDLKP